MSPWAPGAEVQVWVSGWEQECCGEDLRVGRPATLRVARQDPPRAHDAGGILSVPVDVDGWEHHHGETPLPEVTGTVTRVRRVAGRHVPERPGSRVHVPDPGSGRLTDVEGTGRAGDGASGAVGHLVTLRLP